MTTGCSKYLPVFDFGNELFEIWRTNRSETTWCWELIHDFVVNFNNYRAMNFIPSDLICVDESISKFGLGGSWMNTGLPTYVAMERKPVDDCEIQNACCARYHIVMQLKLVGCYENGELDGSVADVDGLPHAVHVQKDLGLLVLSKQQQVSPVEALKIN